MANNFEIVLSALDKTEAAFAKIRNNFKRVGAAADRLKKRFPILSAIAGKSLRFIGGALKAVAKAAVGASIATAGIFAFLTKQSLDATDSLGKTARKIGVTTESLAKMRYAASLTGVATATMDMALQRFTRRAAEAARGTGEAKDALKELGVDAAKIIQMPLEDQMMELSDAFKTLDTDADRVRVAMKLFDSEGVALVNTLGVGSGALADMAQEADELGLVLSGTAVKGVEDANDAFTKLGYLFKGVRDQTVAALAPALEAIANFLTTGFKNAIDDANGSVELFANDLAFNIIEGFESMTKGLAAIMNVVGRVAHEIKAIYRNIFSSADTKRNEIELKRLEQAAFKAGISLKQALDPDSNYADRLSEENQKIVADINLIQGALNAIKNQESEPFVPFTFDGVLTSFEEMKQGLIIKREELGADFIGPLQNDFTVAFGAIGQAVDQTAHTMKSMIGNSVNSILGSTQQLVNGLMQGTEKGSKEHKRLFAISKGIAVAQAIIGGHMAGASTMAAYANAAMTMGPAGPAFAAKGVAMGKVMVGLGYANAAVIAATASKSYEGGGFTGHGARTGGIDGKGGFPAILHPNETVIDHTKGRMASGTSDAVIVNQTINVTTGVQSTVRAEIANLMPQISEAAQNAVLEARMRGGSYSKQLMGR